MKVERWQEVKKVLAGALERTPEQRRVYLDQTCTDPDLRREVESLIIAHEQGKSSFMEQPPPNPLRLQNGTTLGSYTIQGHIGSGGMGEVYRAHDTKLKRDVAIKVLPPAFVNDPERLARFQREARLLASLNHPNIATIYGLEDSDNVHALAMELVEGPTLADRIRKGPIPMEEALPIAKQMAEALEYAHEHGIIHRDLKPANVKVTADDTVKILDFGLAKALESGPSTADMVNSPTISQMATEAGVLLGTAAYMSPEQAKAKPVDRRTDIWAFGCVLYEMLTGKTAFLGDAVTDTLAAVIRAEPDWSPLPAATPMRIRVLLQRCLQKDVRQRLQAIGEARVSIEGVLSDTPEVAPGFAVRLPAWRRAIVWAVGLLTAASIGAGAVWLLKQTPAAPSRRVQRFQITAPSTGVNILGILSPDGTHLLMAAQGPGGGGLWLRRMNSLEAHPIEGTEGAVGVPFWSPDSRYIVFGTSGGELKKIDAEGGSAQVLCNSGVPVGGGFWTPDGKIVFGDPERPPGLWEVSAAGGVASPLLGLEHDSGSPRYAPVLLPDGRHFLYESGIPSQAGVYLASLDSKGGEKTSKKLLSGVLPLLAYVPSPEDTDTGYVLFLRGTIAGRTLMAQPFDVRNLAITGAPVPLADGVSSANFSASQEGTLVYGAVGATDRTSQLTIFNRQGKILGTAGEPGIYLFISFSPDAKRVAATRVNLQTTQQNIWIMDLARGVSTRFTFDPRNDTLPVWSADGRRIVFGSNRAGKYLPYWKLSNGGGNAERLLTSDRVAIPASLSGDGRFLLVGTSSAPAKASAAVLPLDASSHASGKPFVFAEKRVGIDLRFSPGPQGHPIWVAYASNESGRYEVYVRPFDPKSPTGTPPAGGKWQVSTEGGESPRWNGNGKELFYVSPDGTVMSVSVSGGSTTFQSGIPKPLFKPKGLVPQPTGYFDWDASSDGRKFIFAVSQSASAAEAPMKLTVVLNWPALLKK